MLLYVVLCACPQCRQRAVSYFSWQSYSHITHSPQPRSPRAAIKEGVSPRRKIPYCNVVVCNRIGRDKNWTDYKRKNAACKQSTHSKTSATVDGREKNNFLIQISDFLSFTFCFSSYERALLSIDSLINTRFQN